MDTYFGEFEGNIGVVTIHFSVGAPSCGCRGTACEV